MLKAPKLSIFTVTWLANLLAIPLTVLGITTFSINVTAWLFLMFWLIAWFVESLFLGLSLRQELGLGKAFALSLVMNLASLAAGFLLPPGMGFGL